MHGRVQTANLEMRCEPPFRSEYRIATGFRNQLHHFTSPCPVTFRGCDAALVLYILLRPKVPISLIEICKNLREPIPSGHTASSIGRYAVAYMRNMYLFALKFFFFFCFISHAVSFNRNLHRYWFLRRVARNTTALSCRLRVFVKI